MTLGPYPELTLADAHVRLADARKLLAQRHDPGAKAVAQHKAERTAETVAELAEAYLEKWARPRKRSAAEDERILIKDVIPTWGRRKAKDITRRDVIALLDDIVARGAPITANRTLAVIRRMFNWALSRDLVQASPCVAVSPPAKERRRDRVLSVDEIAAFWQALDNPELPVPPTVRLALKFMLVTAQREGEVLGAAWDEFDLAEGVWTIPGARAKNGLPHRVPLSPLARTVLDQAAAAGTGSPWVFPSPRTLAPAPGQSVDRAMHKLGIAGAVPHDLRRTAASHMTSMGISRLVVSKILNHAEPGVTAVYDRHSYDFEKRAALDAWSKRLEEIIGTSPDRSKVVSLRAGT